jgi:hypothetical protein
MNFTRRFPVITSITVGLTAIVTATRLLGDGPLEALRRDPGALGHGQLWRLLSPVLVQSDAGLRNVLLVFVMCAVIGAIAEQLLTRRRWLALYLVGALVGHAIGDVFQPLQGGTSVAFVGILGGLAAYSLVGGVPQLQRFKLQAAVAIPLAVLDTVLGDIHGLPYLAGLALATAWLVRDGSAQPLRAAFARSRARNGGPSARAGKLTGYDSRPGAMRDRVSSRTPMTDHFAQHLD